MGRGITDKPQPIDELNHRPVALVSAQSLPLALSKASHSVPPDITYKNIIKNFANIRLKSLHHPLEIDRLRGAPDTQLPP